jgi:hypothetical protein
VHVPENGEILLVLRVRRAPRPRVHRVVGWDLRTLHRITSAVKWRHLNSEGLPIGGLQGSEVSTASTLKQRFGCFCNRAESVAFPASVKDVLAIFARATTG